MLSSRKRFGSSFFLLWATCTMMAGEGLAVGPPFTLLAVTQAASQSPALAKSLRSIDSSGPQLAGFADQKFRDWPKNTALPTRKKPVKTRGALPVMASNVERPNTLQQIFLAPRPSEALTKVEILDLPLNSACPQGWALSEGIREDGSFKCRIEPGVPAQTNLIFCEKPLRYFARGQIIGCLTG